MKVTNESIKMPITTTSVREKSSLRQSLAELNDDATNSNRDRLVLSKDIISSAKNIKSSVKAEYDTKQLTPKPSITSEEISAEIQRLRLREKRPVANSEEDQPENADQSVPNEDTVDKSSDITVQVTAPGANDTFIMSIDGEPFSAPKEKSISEKFSVGVVSDIDTFRNAVKSMNNDLEINWNAMVDPYGRFAGIARAESLLQQLQDPNVSHKAEDMDKIADQHVQERINSLIEKKKAYIASQPQDYLTKEYEEFKMAYEAYHSDYGKQIIDKMSGDMKKAYGIYKSIIDGSNTSLDDQEFLMLRNGTMYHAAISEYVRLTDEMYK